MVLIRSFDPEIHHRRSVRLRDYDYTLPEAYFITMCATDRNDFFGRIEYNSRFKARPNEFHPRMVLNLQSFSLNLKLHPT